MSQVSENMGRGNQTTNNGEARGMKRQTRTGERNVDEGQRAGVGGDVRAQVTGH